MRDETEMEGVRRARDTVLANVSHEFRTPLAAQLASIELLREGLATKSPAELTELVLSLERGTLRLTRLIDNLLESVRIESGQLDVRRQTIDLVDVIEDARVLIEALVRQRHQTLEVDIPEGLTVQGDAPRLTQVFVNLLANASKFAPEGTAVRVGARVQDQHVSAWVEDQGPGVPASDASNIFERFKRGGTQEPEPGGLGLGLWISRSIVERHGGTLSTSRTAEGFTRFTLTLPVEAPE
jgi:signal transduction histidine kinase